MVRFTTSLRWIAAGAAAAAFAAGAGPHPSGVEAAGFRSGHPGRTTRTIESQVRGTGEMAVTCDSMKGGAAVGTVVLG